MFNGKLEVCPPLGEGGLFAVLSGKKVGRGNSSAGGDVANATEVVPSPAREPLANIFIDKVDITSFFENGPSSVSLRSTAFP